MPFGLGLIIAEAQLRRLSDIERRFAPKLANCRKRRIDAIMAARAIIGEDK